MGDDVSQLRELIVDLAGASKETVVLTSRAVRKAALDVEAHAKRLAPVDTGALRSSITTSTGISGLEAEVGPTVHYGLYQELGTARMAPQPYMGPALEVVEPGFLEAVAQIGVSVLEPS